MKAESEENANTLLAIFAFLWAMAVVFHQAKWSYWLVSPNSFILSVSAFLVLLRPSSLLRFLLLVGLQVWETLQQLPRVSNHFLFMSFVNMTILLSFGYLALSSKRLPFDKARLFHTFAPVVRIELLLLYVISVFSKLNVDWFIPEVSCGSTLFLRLASRFPFLPTSSWAQLTVIYASLIIEALIPLFLLIPGLRLAGILLAAAFHLVLGISGFFNFSAVIFAVVFLFVPANFVALFRSWWATSFIRQWSRPLAKPMFWEHVFRWATLFLIVVAAAVFIRAPWTYFNEAAILLREVSISNPQRTTISYSFEALWWLYGPALIVVFSLSMKLGKAQWCEVRELIGVPHGSFAVFPLLIFMNGLSPYLGLKTETSFSMFSNLRTEGGLSNHLIIGQPLSLASYQTDLVTIVRSSDPELQKIADRGYLLPYFELTSYISSKARFGIENGNLTFIRGGLQRSVKEVDNDRELSRSPPNLLRKFLYFRPVYSGRMNKCQH